MAGVKAFLVLSVAALYFAVVPRGVGANELVPNTELGSCLFKKGRQVTPAVGKPVGELKAIVGLDTLHLNAPADIPFYKPFQEISRGIGHAGQDRSSAHRVWANISSFPYQPKTVPAFA